MPFDNLQTYESVKHIVLIYFMTPGKAVMSLKHKELQGLAELGTEKIIMSRKRREQSRRQ